MSQGLQRTDKEEVGKLSEKKNFLVQVTLHEARNLKSTRKSGLVNCYAMINVANGIPQTTHVIEETVQATWAQQFTFKSVCLTELEKEQYEITLTIFDHSDFLANKIVGSASIGLGYLYNQSRHEIYYKWITIKHPEDPKSQASGYILQSCYIIGEGDDPPMHDANEVPEDDDYDQFAGMDENELLDLKPEEILIRKNKAKNYSLMSDPKIHDNMYQLYVHVVHATELKEDMDCFVSCRVLNYVMTTELVVKSKSPKFGTRFCFPIAFPQLNDKIILKMWKKGLMSDTFYGNIPENPFFENKFHINYLQAAGGNMPFTWVNLYGIPEHERSGWWSNTFSQKKQKFVEGTDYLGRVLISMVLRIHENPELERTRIDGWNDPESAQFGLFCNCYKLDVTEKSNSQVYVMVNFAGKIACSNLPKLTKKNEKSDKKEKSSSRKKAPEKNDKNENLRSQFAWSDRNSKIEYEEYIEVPKNLSMAPDLIISLCKGKPPSKEKFLDPTNFERIGYARIPSDSDFLQKNHPQWIKFKSVFNNYDGESPGTLLMNARLFMIDPNNKNNQIQHMSNNTFRNITESSQTLVIHIWGCTGLFPYKNSNKIDAAVNINFLNEESIVISEKTCAYNTRNPVFDKIICIETEVSDSLQFVEPINITVENLANKSWAFSENEIASVSIPTSRIGYESAKKQASEARFKPEVHTLRYHDKIMGKIIVSYDFIKGKVADKFRNYPANTYTEGSSLLTYFEKDRLKAEQFYLFKYSLFGLRNVPSGIFKSLNIERKKVVCKIFNSVFERPIWVAPDDDMNTYFDESVNICKTNTKDWSDDVQANYKLRENNNSKGSTVRTTGCSMLSSIPPFKLLVDYKICWPEFEVEFYALDELPTIDRSGNIKLTDNEKPIDETNDPVFFMQISLVEVLKNLPKTEYINYRSLLGYEGKVAASRSMHDKTIQLMNSRKKSSRVSQVRASTNQSRAVSKSKSNYMMSQRFSKKSNINIQNRKSYLGNLETIKEEKIEFDRIEGNESKAKEQLERNLAKYGDLEENEGETYHEEINEFDNADAGRTDEFQDTYYEQIPNVYFEDSETEPLFNYHKDRIEVKNNEDYENYKKNVYAGYCLNLTGDKKRQEKRHKEYLINKIKEEIKDLKKAKDIISVEEFSTKLNRKLKGIRKIKADFMTYNKFCNYDNLQDLLKVNYGREIFHGNYQNELVWPYNTYKLFQYSRQSWNSLSLFNENVTKFNDYVKSGHQCETVFKGKFELIQISRLKSYEDTTEVKNYRFSANEKKDEFTFDIYNQFMLNELKKTQKLRVRFNLLRCVNLAGQTNKASLKDKMSGYEAISAANAYPMISIGSNTNNDQNNSGETKTFDDVEMRKKNDLSPRFFKLYELDALLPNDDIFRCTIKNWIGVSIAMKSDPIIGSSSVDIEDRFWSNKKELNKACYYGLTNYIKKSEKELENNKDSTRRQKLKDLEKKIESWYEKANYIKKKKQPIEYLPLKQEKSETRVGTVESLLEVMTRQEARVTPKAQLQDTAVQEFEIRLIIWEVNDIPLDGNDNLSLMCKAQVDMEGDIEGVKIEKVIFSQ